MFTYGDPRLPRRFWIKTWPSYDSSCAVWLAAKNPAGYGHCTIGRYADDSRRLVLAHRLAYETLVAAVPEGLELDHLCRIRACVNTDHLEPVTRHENIVRGDGPATTHARASLVTHCPQGHEYTDTNTYRYADGRRQCRACHRLRDARRRAPTR